jgi:hypothetical protein
MANKPKRSAVNTESSKLSRWQPGSAEQAALLEAGYGMSIDDAKAVIAERDANPHTHPYEEYRRAKAMLAALNASPAVIATKPPFVRDEYAET